MTTTIEPVETTNLDGYGFAPLPWSRPQALLDQTAAPDAGGGAAHLSWWLGTTRPDGTPHVAAVGALWSDGTIYFTSGAGTRKSRNLAANPHCAFSVVLQGLDLVVEGTAVITRDEATLERLCALYNLLGWEPSVKDGAFTAAYSAPSAGPPPWDLYAMTPVTMFGVATAEPYGATRWRFGG
jgi:nitroimidazol reductase NimA-like FMN-containing flavoprotein (pyridoxamine 5'-phosphate oxidase superfamily)